MDRRRLLVIVAIGSAAVGALVPLWALGSVLVTVVTAVALSGRARLAVAVAGGLLSAVATGRFLIEYAAPNVVSSGEKAAEEKAVSRLREIWFAQTQGREAKVADDDHDGIPEFLPFERLIDEDAGLLRPGLYRMMSPGVMRIESYDVVGYLPKKGGGFTRNPEEVDLDGAETRWMAYAWPVSTARAGSRVFFIDQDEHVCERPNNGKYVGPDAVPDPFAAFTQPRIDAARCMAGTDGGVWKRWKHKGMRQDGASSAAPTAEVGPAPTRPEPHP